MKTIWLKFWLGAVASVVLWGVPARAGSVSATLDPAQISMGDSAQMTVTVSGSQDQPEMPNVDGLEIQLREQSTQIQIINGSITSGVSNVYTITPQRAGTFTIPAIHAGSAASQPVTLRVSGSGGAVPSQPQSAPQQPSSAGPVVTPSQPPQAQPEAVRVPQGKFGAIEITLPQKEFYEGELAPIEIKVSIPDDVQVTDMDLPQFTSDGFTLNALSRHPQRQESIVNGRSYTVLSWRSAVTAVKAGDFSMKLQMPLTVVVATQMPQMDDAFRNFFQNAMSGFGTKKNVTIAGDSVALKVLPLPQANRPADFSGAVGVFEIEGGAAPAKVNVGDPVTLKLKITGRGNFDRVSSEMLANDANWKTYSPKSQFQSDDGIGYGGTKVFEQPAVPLNGSIREVPPLSFSYFNPETKQYVTRLTAAVPITVNGAPAAAPVPPVVASTTAPQTSPAPTAAPAPPVGPELRPNKLEPGFFASTLRPVYLSPWFVGGQGIPLLALLGALTLLRRHRLNTAPDRLRLSVVQQAIRRETHAMDAAMEARQSGAFFVHARNVLQQRFGQEWNMRPEAITLADVESRLGNGNENMRLIFSMADQASYSDLHFAASDLREWREVVMREITEKPI